MLSTLLFLASFGFAQENSLLIEKAQSEISTPMEALPEKAPSTKKGVVSQSVDTGETPQMVLQFQDDYRTPKIRSYDWRLDLAYESFQLQGQAPNDLLGNYDIRMAGDIPFLTLRLGFLKRLQSGVQLGAHAYGSYGMHQYDYNTQTQTNLSPRLNVVSYGAGLAGRLPLREKLFTEAGYDMGNFMIRQSSSQSSLANWSEDSKTQVEHLSLGYDFSSGWEISGGYLARQIPGSKFDLASSNWFLATGVLW